MANSDTEHSKQLRIDSANRRRQRIIEEGGKQLSVLLRAPAYAILRAECERLGLKEGTVIEQMLLDLKKEC